MAKPDWKQTEEGYLRRIAELEAQAGSEELIESLLDAAYNAYKQNTEAV